MKGWRHLDPGKYIYLGRFKTLQQMLLQIRGKVGMATKREDVEIPSTNCGRSERGSNVAEARDIGWHEARLVPIHQHQEIPPLSFWIFIDVFFLLCSQLPSSSVGFNFPRLERLETRAWEGGWPATCNTILEVLLEPAMLACNLEGVQHCTRPAMFCARSWWPPPCGGCHHHISTLQTLLHTWFRWKILELEPIWRGVDGEDQFTQCYKFISWSEKVIMMWSSQDQIVEKNASIWWTSVRPSLQDLHHVVLQWCLGAIWQIRPNKQQYEATLFRRTWKRPRFLLLLPNYTQFSQFTIDALRWHIHRQKQAEP